MARSLTLLVLLVGCPGEPDAPETGDSGPAPRACPADSLVEGAFRVDPGDLLSQIHPAAAWDGEAVWVAYALPQPSSANFDLWATRISTAGEALVAPLQLDGGVGWNETYPRLAVSDGRAVVAWQADDGTGVDNMHLMLRALDVDGGGLDASPSELEPTVGGVAQTGNAWMPTLAADPSGGFALGGAFALDDVGTFQAARQRLDPQGRPEGDAVVPLLDGAQSHYYPSVAVGPQGQRLLAWEAWTADAGTAIRFDEDGVGGAFADHDDAGIPAAAWERAPDGQPYLAWYALNAGRYSIELAGGDLANAPVTTTLGEQGKIDHSPIMAAGERGAVLAWMRNISGLSNELVLQAVKLEDGTWTTSEELVLATDTPVAPYLQGLTWLCEDAWFVTWIEGDNPDYVVMGQFLRFEGFGG
jgi:hypothetical protein